MSGIGEEFMRKTRIQFLGQSPQARGLPEPPCELAPEPDKPAIALPPPADLRVQPVSLRGLIEQRRSMREYSRTPLSLAELSYLLWCTQGVQERGDGWSLRTVPSAGGRHAFETYLLVNRVASVAPGLHRYHAPAHTLIELESSDKLARKIEDACHGQVMVGGSAVTFIWVAVAARMTWRYHERGYRYLHLDAGHVCQNLYLAAESIGAGVCAIGAFDDDDLNKILKLDGREQFAIYLASVGKKR